MKKIYTILFCGLFALSAKSQSNISLYAMNDTINPINGTLITVQGAANSTMQADIYMKQMSGGSMIVKTKGIEQSYVTGSKHYFCWAVCYAPKTSGTVPVFVSPDPVTVANNTLNTQFYAHYLPEDNAGSTTIRYVFYDVNNDTDSAYVDVKYMAWPLGIKTISAQNQISMRPNPAQNNLTISLGNNSNLKNIKIYDLVGNIVYQSNIQNNTTKSIDVSKLNDGVYFVKFLTDDNAVETRKLFIQH